MNASEVSNHPKIKEFLEAFPEIIATIADEGSFCLGTEGHERTFTLSFYEEEWALYTEEWHGHFDDLHELCTVALAIATGFARIANEFRGEKLSATWLEVFNGESYDVRNESMYLTPFDADEWKLWPGERWKVTRFTRRLVNRTPQGRPPPPEVASIEIGTVERSDTFPDKSSIDGSQWMIDFFETLFGPPLSGMKWTFSGRRAVVFQAPKELRRIDEKVPEEEKQEGDILLGESRRILYLRLREFSRETPLEGQFEPILAIPKLVSQNHQYEETIPWSDAFSGDTYELIYSDGQEDLMLQFFLMKRKSAKVDISQLREAFENGFLSIHFEIETHPEG